MVSDGFAPISPLYSSLKRCLKSEINYIYDLTDDDEDFCLEEAAKRTKMQDEGSHKGIMKVAFEIHKNEFELLKKQAQKLLGEIIALTFHQDSLFLMTKLETADFSSECLNVEFPFRNTIYNTTLCNIPETMKCKLTSLPRVIVELMMSLSDKESKRELGAFRIDSYDMKMKHAEKSISLGVLSDGFKFSESSIVCRMTVLKRFFRNIPGQLVDKNLSELIGKIYASYENSSCLFVLIRWMLNCLPLDNFKSLGFLCLFLRSYTKEEEYNYMSAEAMATCWAPVVFNYRADLNSVSSLKSVFSLLIKNWDQFFIMRLD